MKKRKWEDVRGDLRLAALDRDLALSALCSDLHRRGSVDQSLKAAYEHAEDAYWTIDREARSYRAFWAAGPACRQGAERLDWARLPKELSSFFCFRSRKSIGGLVEATAC